MAYGRCKQCDEFESKYAKENIEYHNPYWTQHKDACLSFHRGISSAQLEFTLGCNIVEEALDRRMIFLKILVDGDNDIVEKLNQRTFLTQ